MNDNGADRDLQRLFAAYDPALSAQPFLDQTFSGLNREIRRARIRTTLIYASSAILITAVAAMTASPLNAAISTLDRHLDSLASGLSPTLSQILIYAATFGLIALARRRLKAFLAPW